MGLVELLNIEKPSIEIRNVGKHILPRLAAMNLLPPGRNWLWIPA